MSFMDCMEMALFKCTSDVNVSGLTAMTKTMLTRVKLTKYSRVIMVRSVVGHFAGPGLGAYSASKHAVEGFAKALRQELHPWDTLFDIFQFIGLP